MDFVKKHTGPLSLHTGATCEFGAFSKNLIWHLYFHQNAKCVLGVLDKNINLHVFVMNVRKVNLACFTLPIFLGGILEIRS